MVASQQTAAAFMAFVIPDERLAERIRDLLDQRSAEASICPSEVARSFERGAPAAWRELMPRVREVAVRMAEAGEIRITQGEETLDPAAPLAGPIRLRRAQ